LLQGISFWTFSYYNCQASFFWLAPATTCGSDWNTLAIVVKCGLANHLPLYNVAINTIGADECGERITGAL